jgi:hypothetical protein
MNFLSSAAARKFSLLWGLWSFFLLPEFSAEKVQHHTISGYGNYLWLSVPMGAHPKVPLLI